MIISKIIIVSKNNKYILKQIYTEKKIIKKKNKKEGTYE